MFATEQRSGCSDGAYDHFCSAVAVSRNTVDRERASDDIRQIDKARPTSTQRRGLDGALTAATARLVTIWLLGGAGGYDRGRAGDDSDQACHAVLSGSLSEQQKLTPAARR